MKAKAALWLLLPVLAGCSFLTPERPYYNAHEVELLTENSSERLVYFYGDAMEIRLEGTPLRLVPQGPAQFGPLEVNGMPYYREVSPPTRPRLEALEDIGGQYFELRVGTAILGAWLFDGDRWYRLSTALATGADVAVRPEPFTPGFQRLTYSEAKSVRRMIEELGSNGPVVVFERSAPSSPPYDFEPAPWVYRRASLRIQTSVPKVPLSPALIRPWHVLARGSYASYSDRQPLGLLACTQTAYLQIWQRATGNQLPRPPLPDLKYPRSCVAAFFWGLKPTGGYRIDVASVEVKNGLAKIRLLMQEPSLGARVTQALTSPYILVEIKGTPSEAWFYDPSGRLLAQAKAE